MAARTKKCVSCYESLPRGVPARAKEYEDAIHHFSGDGDFLYAERREPTIHVDKKPAYAVGLHCKGCNTDAGRIYRRDPTYLRDHRESHVENTD